ncbi:YqgE/AlgH family protein [Loktanella sp. R86503]|uniref:YqgE/AlgH family protein n=1 Tax=Loktanella sp. R86503 TaxID=3093847 RepID=UPI0036D9A040
MDEMTTLAGKLLIAMPDMEDPRFAGSVIYICDHSPEGTMGLIINRPLPDIAFRKLLAQMNISCSDACPDVDVHFGGPVEKVRGFVLHSSDYAADKGTLQVDDDIGMTATQDVLQALADGAGPATALLALGYTGWGPGQLEEELAENGWLTGPANRDIVFGSDHAGKWSAALALLGVSPVALSQTGGRA